MRQGLREGGREEVRDEKEEKKGAGRGREGGIIITYHARDIGTCTYKILLSSNHLQHTPLSVHRSVQLVIY